MVARSAPPEDAGKSLGGAVADGAARRNHHGALGSASLMRHINRCAVIDLLRRGRPASRSHIARSLGISLPTVMRIVDDLIADNLVCLAGQGQSTGGRPSPLLRFDGHSNLAIGIDLGGTKMFGALLDLSGSVLHEIYSPLSRGPDADNLSQLTQLVDELIGCAQGHAGRRLLGIGLGVPSVVLQPQGVVNWAPSLGWRDLPLLELLSERFSLPVYLENDVNLAALGETDFGAGQGASCALTICIGTGIGAGIVIDGAIYHGHHQAAGEIGYMLPHPSCLGRAYHHFGALEALASGSGIAERARPLSPSQDGAEVTAESVFEAARRGEPWAAQVVADTVDYLAQAIANITCLLDPEVVVLGGGVALSADLLVEPISSRLAGIVPFAPRIVASPLGRLAGVMGAVSLVLDATTKRTTVSRFG